VTHAPGKAGAHTGVLIHGRFGLLHSDRLDFSLLKPGPSAKVVLAPLLRLFRLRCSANAGCWSVEGYLSEFGAE